MKTSALVAFRDSSPDQHRQRLWDFIRARFEREHPDIELVACSDDGQDPFHKTQALNRAAAIATGEAFYILDADSWVPPSQLREAVAGIEADPSHWWRPWTQKVKLNERSTRVLLRMDDWDGVVPAAWYQSAENRNRYWAAPPLLLHRDLFEQVGGMDERFRGWGHEDDAFAWALRAFSGPALSVEGRCIHLNHPRIGRSGRDIWPGQEVFGPNLKLAKEYRTAGRDPEAMRALIAGRQT